MQTSVSSWIQRVLEVAAVLTFRWSSPSLLCLMRTVTHSARPSRDVFPKSTQHIDHTALHHNILLRHKIKAALWDTDRGKALSKPVEVSWTLDVFIAATWLIRLLLSFCLNRVCFWPLCWSKLDHLNILALIEDPIIWSFSIIDHYSHMRFLPKRFSFVSQNSRHACFLHWLIRRIRFISFGRLLNVRLLFLLFDWVELPP